MSLVSNRYSLVIIGGLDLKTNYLSDAWSLNLLQMRWTHIITEPSIESFFGGLCKHASAANNTSIFIMGGHYLK